MAHSSSSALLDIEPPKAWRRLIPGWLCSLIWVDSAAEYDAFLSYSWKADGKVAPVIQSVLQRFLCPWYKLRAKTIFRDLSSLPAGSSLQGELFNRLDRSEHLIVLACPEAAHSGGMEMEAAYWFSRPRDGEVLIIVTAGEVKSWEEIRDKLLPVTVRTNLADEPLWIPLQHRRSEILTNPDAQKLRGVLVEDLKQVFLQLYKPRTWEELQGEERAQRRRALQVITGVAVLVVMLAAGMFVSWRNAELNRQIALARQLAIRSELLRIQQPELLERSLLLAVESLSRFERLGVYSLEADQSVRQALAIFPRTVSKLSFPAPGAWEPSIFLREGQLLVTEHNAQLLFFETASGKEKARIELGGPMVDFSRLSPGRILSASRDSTHFVFELPGQIVILDTETLREQGRIPVEHAPWSIALSPDGKYLVTAHGETGTITVYDTENRIPVAAFDTGWRVFGLSFDGTGAYLLSTGRQNRSAERNEVYGWISVRKVGTWHELAKRVDPEIVPHFVHSPDGKMAAFVDTGREQELRPNRGVQILDLGTLKTKTRLPHGSDVSAIAYDPTGHYLATGAWDNFARICDVRRPQPFEIRRFSEAGIVSLVSFAARGEYLLTASQHSRTAHMWESDGGQEVGRIIHSGRLAFLSVVNPETADIAIADANGSASVVSIMGRDAGHWPYPERVQAVSVAPDGSKIAYQMEDNTVHIAQVDGAKIATLPYGPAAPTRSYSGSSTVQIRFSADGSHLAAGAAWGSNPAVRVWDLEDPNRARTISQIDRADQPFSGFGDEPTVRSVALDASGVAVAIATPAGAQVNDVRSGGRLFSLPRKGGYVDATYSRDGTLLAACSHDGELNLWKVPRGPEGRPETKLNLTHKPGCKRVVFSPDASLIAVIDTSHGVAILDAKSGSDRTVLYHDSAVPDLAFSTDGQYVATGTSDGFVRVWDARTGKQISQLDQRGYVQAVSFDAAGKYLVAADGYIVRAPASQPPYSQNYVRKWLWRPRDLIGAACGHVSRNLSKLEWDTFVADGPCRPVCPNVMPVCAPQ